MGDIWNRCQDCGRFIPFHDFANRRAVHYLLEPDSDLGVEKWVTLCPEHLTEDIKKARAQVAKERFLTAVGFPDDASDG